MIRPLAELRIFYVVVTICLMFSIYATYQANHRAYANCKRVELLKAYALDTVTRTQKTLPLSAYYVAHPEELRDQLKILALEEGYFAPRTCHESVFDR